MAAPPHRSVYAPLAFFNSLHIPRPALTCLPLGVAGVAASLLLGLNVIRSYKKHLGQFVADITGDSVSGGAAMGGPKAE